MIYLTDPADLHMVQLPRTLLKVAYREDLAEALAKTKTLASSDEPFATYHLHLAEAIAGEMNLEPIEERPAHPEEEVWVALPARRYLVLAPSR